MGGAPSTPSHIPDDSAEYLISTFVGEKTFPMNSEFWHKLLELPLHLHWPPNRVLQACHSLVQNNCHTRHMAKLLIHFACCLQDCTSVSDAPSTSFAKALNAVHLSSVFLKYAIENSQTDNFEELYLALDENEAVPSGFSKGQSVESFVIHSVLNFICKVEASPHTYRLHYELLNFMMVAMSTQLLSGPSPGPKDVHPFSNAVMAQEASLVAMVVHILLMNYISQPRSNFNGESFSEGSHPGVLQKVGSAAANLVLLPLNLFVGSNYEASRVLLGKSSLHLLLILVHFRKCIVVHDPFKGQKDDKAASDVPEKKTHFSENPYNMALENARDVEFDRTDVEGNAHCGPLVRLPFASLYDTLGMCLADEGAALLLYSLVQGNADFLEYVLVRTDLDTLLMPILEILYNAPTRTSNQIYMLLIILLILSQDSTFNASIHKLILPNVPWYQERRLHRTSLGSLMVVVLIRTVKYNLSRLQDIYLHTNCLAALANMAPHAHRLDAYASQRLVSLFHMLSRKYTKLAEIQNDKMQISNVASAEEGIVEAMSMELHIYTDFLRIVLEIINAILTYSLPQNPEVVYAVMHRQEVFQPFRNHPRFNELLENIFTVIDFFNSRMDAQEVDGEWSVEKVLQVIVNNCRSWRGDGMKMFTQLRFTYEQESHPEEFFIPYVWQLAVSNCEFAFNPSKINLFSVDQSAEQNKYTGEETVKHQSVDISPHETELDV
ncbi:uncharacterized protein LOC141642331 [Silene latifolia]|uniref:uncharacterized protein LOC141642331 n=1 Tax=Silene latifolia TaxID=37657 RepID=UPI003D776B9F